MQKSTGPSTTTTKTKTNDQRVPALLKEKQYITRKVNTSISILDSPENDIVLESLMFLSKYADIKVRNLIYLQQLGITPKLINLMDRNICILRLTLRFLALLLEKTPLLAEIDQDIYDDKFLKITHLYINHKDQNVREFCLDILSRLAKSCRITCLIFKEDLFKPILETIRRSPNTSQRISALNFLNHLLDSPVALRNLQKTLNFDVKTLVTCISDDNIELSQIGYVIINKISSKDIFTFQKAFRENHLVEKMMEVIMNSSQENFHKQAMEIIENCLNSDETRTYYIQSIQFLQLCNWAKSCEDMYLRTCANIFEKLTSIPEMIQIMYDLSVEESVISLLRSNVMEILNKTSKAICNFTEHTYCCEDMLKTTVINSLVDILGRKNGILENELALETIYCFFIRTIKSLPILYENKIIPILLKYFTEPNNLSKASNGKVLDMLYKFSIISEYKPSVIGDIFFEKLLNISISGTVDIAVLSLEILIHFIEENSLQNILLKEDGPKLLLQRLKSISDSRLIKFFLLFIRKSMAATELSKEFVKNDVIGCLKSLPPSLGEGAIVDTITTLAYKCYLPLKFFESGKLDVTDKFSNNFYIIKGRNVGQFPFIEMIEAERLCPISILYIVDYTYVLKNNNVLISIEQEEYSKSFGTIPHDVYLPSYIKYVSNKLLPEWNSEQKIDFLAKYVDDILGMSSENNEVLEKHHNFNLHLEFLKYKLQTSVVPVGYLRLGFHCEKALLFKAIADMVNIPCTLENRNNIYWNEVSIFQTSNEISFLNFFVVDLMDDVGALLPISSKRACKYISSTISLM